MVALVLAVVLAAGPGPELHVVCGRVPRTDGGRIAVKVDRPGKQVVLVVDAGGAAEWEVTAAPGTKLTRVILGGYRRQSAKVPAGVEVEEMSVECQRHRILPVSVRAPHTLDSEDLRPFVLTLHRLTGLEIHSLQEVSRVDPGAPFVVRAVKRDERVSSQYPKVTPAADLPDVKFRATRLRTVDDGLVASFGDFTRTGPGKDPLRALPGWIVQVAHDPKRDVLYGITGSEVHVVDPKAGTSASLGLEVARPLRLRGVTYDTKRERLLVANLNELYEYTAANGGRWRGLVWNVPIIFAGVGYHAKSDTLYAVGQDLVDPDKRVPMLYELNPAGVVVKATELGAPMFRGVFGRNGLDGRVELVDAGDRLAAVVHLEHPNWNGGERLREAFLFLIDPKTGKAQLAWKE